MVPEPSRSTTVSSEEKRRYGGLVETIRTMATALIIAAVIRTLLFQAFSIPSGSMEATLLVGDYLFVSTYAYGYTHYALPFSPPVFPGRIFGSQPKRGDVAVFRLPGNDSIDYIKRVIGLPGDRIEMIDGLLHINGVAVKRERAEDYIEREGQYPTRVRRWRETLPNGVSYETLDRVEFPVRQHSALHSAARAFLHDGRQPRQLQRQQSVTCEWWGRLCAVREYHRSRRNHLLLDR